MGDMTDELGGDDYITEFVLGGPKNYVYATDKGDVCCKVRGFSLKSVRGSSQLNFHILKNNVLNELTDPHGDCRNINIVNPHFFTRTPQPKGWKSYQRPSSTNWSSTREWWTLVPLLLILMGSLLPWTMMTWQNCCALCKYFLASARSFRNAHLSAL